ncbi:uncharacterized protein BDZ83DRAFT_595734, partial [Colletotrichum acutatum]
RNANRFRIKRLTLKKGDSAYFLYYNIRIKRLNNKLNYKKLRPFKIIKRILPVNYKLKLLNIIKYYLVFYILLSKLIFKSLYIENCIIIKLNELEYKVERIIDYRIKNKI